MSEKSLELISALADDELENGSEFIINAMADTPEYRDAWCRYHLIGEALRGNLPVQVDMQLADKISAVIASEPRLSYAPDSSRQFRKTVAGFAIAASVTIVAILGVRQAGIGPAGPSSPVVAGNPVENSSYQVVASTEHSPAPVNEKQVQEYTFPVDAESRLNRYLVNHNESRTVGVQGMLPYVRIVAHEVEK